MKSRFPPSFSMEGNNEVSPGESVSGSQITFRSMSSRWFSKIFCLLKGSFIHQPRVTKMVRAAENHDEEYVASWMEFRGQAMTGSRGIAGFSTFYGKLVTKKLVCAPNPITFRHFYAANDMALL